jgi:phage terminase large subunit-like protein
VKVSPGVRGFFRFCDAIGFRLETHQRKIATAAFGTQREVVALVSRGNGKSILCAALALHHVLTVPKPAAYIAASSRDQARIIFEFAKEFARHPLIESEVTTRHLELRVPDGFLRCLASDAPKVHGLSPTLALIDELHAHKDGELYLALLTAMLKRPGARMVTISTAGSGAESVLGRLRARALGLPTVSHRGSFTDAQGPTLRLLEWAVPDDGNVDDPRQVKAANPASWITVQGLAEQREAVQDRAFRRYHCGQWTETDRHWLPPGAWQRCAGDALIEPGEPVWVGVDVGGERSASAVVVVTADLRVNAFIYTGDEAVLDCAEKVRALAGDFEVRELVHDPWRFQQAALELEREGLRVVQVPQSASRMIPASERLHRAVIEGRITHPNDPRLNAHVANAIAKDTPRGWRLDKAHRRAQIDGVVALAMAVERAEHRPAPVQLLGWV